MLLNNIKHYLTPTKDIPIPILNCVELQAFHNLFFSLYQANVMSLSKRKLWYNDSDKPVVTLPC